MQSSHCQVTYMFRSGFSQISSVNVVCVLMSLLLHPHSANSQSTEVVPLHVVPHSALGFAEWCAQV